MSTQLGELDKLFLDEGLGKGNEITKVLEATGQIMQGTAGAKAVSFQQWQGFPVIICGRDPADDSFFLTEQSVFQRDKKQVAKSAQNVATMFNGPLQKVMLGVFDALNDVGIKSIYTLSVLFADNKKNITRDGESYITFEPARVNYSVKLDTDVGRKIQQALYGFAVLNEMRGSNLELLNPAKATEIPELKTSNKVWVTPLVYTDITGLAAMSMFEKDIYSRAIRDLKSSMKGSRNAFTLMQKYKNYQLGVEIKGFFDRTYRVGSKIDPKVNYNQFFTFMSAKFNQSVGTKDGLRLLGAVGVLEEDPAGFGQLLASYLQIKYCLSIIMTKFKAIAGSRLFVDRGSYYQITDRLQFVGVNTGQSVRLVNELTFKGLDISLPKRWDK